MSSTSKLNAGSNLSSSSSSSSISSTTPANLTHKAFEMVQVVDKLPLSIECMTCYDNIFILGLNNGRIVIYEINKDPQQPAKFDVNIVTQINATKKPIQQLSGIKKFGILIALFDAQLHVFDLDVFRIQYSINKTKGCSLFAASMTADQKLLRLCVVCKKRLQFYYMNIASKGTGQFMELVSDLELSDTPRTLEFTKDNLIVFAMRKDYYYYEVPSTSSAISSSGSARQAELKFGSGNRSIEPLCEKLHNDFIVLGIDENRTVVFDTYGKPYLEYPVVWLSTPSAVCNIGSYLIGVVPSLNCLEIVTVQPSSVSVQLVEFTKDILTAASVTSLLSSTPSGTSSSGLSSSFTGPSSFLSNAINPVLAVANNVSTLTSSLTSEKSLGGAAAISPSDRIKLLQSNGNSICYVTTASNVWCLTPIKINDQLEHILRHKNYELGLNLISSQLFFNQANECLFAKPGVNSNSSGLLNEKFSGILSQFYTNKCLTNDIDENLYRKIKNLNALDLFCKKRFVDSFQLFQEMQTDPSHIVAFLPGLLPDAYRNKLKYDEYYPNLSPKEIEEATKSLIDYLQYKRKELLKDNKPLSDMSNLNLIPLMDGRSVIKTRSQLLQIIDTTLLKCYLKVKESLVPFFLRREQNFLHLEESERLLMQHNKLNELIILYEKKESHEKALSLLVSESAKPSSQLKDLNHIVKYMKKMGNKNLELIFKYAKSVIESNSEIGMKIFMDNSVEIDEVLAKRAKKKQESLRKNRMTGGLKSLMGSGALTTASSGSKSSSLLSVLLNINQKSDETTTSNSGGGYNLIFILLT
jgi:hypothetical protein